MARRRVSRRRRASARRRRGRRTGGARRTPSRSVGGFFLRCARRVMAYAAAPPAFMDITTGASKAKTAAVPWLAAIKFILTVALNLVTVMLPDNFKPHVANGVTLGIVGTEGMLDIYLEDLVSDCALTSDSRISAPDIAGMDFPFAQARCSRITFKIICDEKVSTRGGTMTVAFMACGLFEAGTSVAEPKLDIMSWPGAIRRPATGTISLSYVVTSMDRLFSWSTLGSVRGATTSSRTRVGFLAMDYTDVASAQPDAAMFSATNFMLDITVTADMQFRMPGVRSITRSASLTPQAVGREIVVLGRKTNTVSLADSVLVYADNGTYLSTAKVSDGEELDDRLAEAMEIIY